MTETSDRATAAPDTPPPAPPSAGVRLPEIPGPVETAVRAWRRLRRMSTALALLFALAVAAIVATFVPQEPVVPQTVAQWRAGTAGPGEAVATVFDALDLFDVFGSWWFATLTVLLFVSLTGCLIPRWRNFLRALRRPPARGGNLARLAEHVVVPTELPPGAALDAASAALRRYRRRTFGADGAAPAQVAAERGHWREGGSLVFHSAFYLLLTGVVIGHAFGFTGQINLAEGASFADTRIAYDAARPGRFWDLSDHRGFVVTLDDFDVSYHGNAVPREFVSTVTISEDGEPVRRGTLRVNHPLTYRGMKLFQARFGMAPRLVVRVGDDVVFDEPVLLAQARGGNAWVGSAKIDSVDPQRQIALDLVLAPDARLDEEGRPVIGSSPEPRNPVLIADIYFGALGLERTRPASEFDRSGGPAGPPIMLRPGRRVETAEDLLSVEFAELSYWSGFQVSHAPGRRVLLLAAVLVLVGLLPSLYSYRRRIWLEARPTPTGGTDLVVAGLALQRKAAFTDDFGRLVADIRERVAAREQGSNR